MAAQQQPPPPQPPPLAQRPWGPQVTFRSLSDLVQVDVVAVDKDGNPVLGLKASDFTLFDRKRPQTIAAFEEISHERPAGAASDGPALPPTVKRDVASNQSAQSDRLVVMVIDDLHIFKNRTDRTREIARTVVTDLGAQASMAVLFTSGEHSIEVTEDRSELLAAIAQFKARRPFPRPILGFDNLHGNSLDPVIGIAEFYDDMNTYKTMQDAARMLGAGDGRRKAFVFISEGSAQGVTGIFSTMAPAGDAPQGGLAYAMTGDASNTIVPDPQQYHAWAIIDMMDAMRRSNVTTYAIDPRGHVSSQELLRECHPSFIINDPCPGNSNWTGWVRMAQQGLEITAQASGGFAITNTDDFTGGLQRIIQDLDHYYLLGFYPADPGKKGYRNLDVKTNNPDITLRFRHGYDAGGPPAPPKNKDPLVALSAGVMPVTDLALRLTATPLPGGSIFEGPGRPVARGETRVAISLEISAARDELVGAGGKVAGSLRYTVLAANLKSGKVVKQFTNTAELKSDAEATLPAGESIGFQFPVELSLAPGRYQLRASAQSDSLSRGGSVYLALDVPDFASMPLAMSGLMIGYADGAHVAVAKSRTTAGAAANPAAQAGADRFVPTLDREFGADQTLRVRFELGGSRVSSVSRGALDLLDAAGKVIKTLPAAIQAGRGDLRVPLAGMATGAYVLRVTIDDQQKPLQREVGFIVK